MALKAHQQSLKIAKNLPILRGLIVIENEYDPSCCIRRMNRFVLGETQSSTPCWGQKVEMILLSVCSEPSRRKTEFLLKIVSVLNLNTDRMAP